MGASVDENAFFFQFLCRRIRTHIPILAGAQNLRMLVFKKKNTFLKKCSF